MLEASSMPEFRSDFDIIWKQLEISKICFDQVQRPQPGGRAERTRSWIKQSTLGVYAVRAGILLAIAVGLEVGVTSGALDPIFSSPSQIAQTFLVLVSNGQLPIHVWTTFYEVVLGFVIGALLGAFCGLLLSRLTFTARVIVPFFIMIYGLPSVVLAPLFHPVVRHRRHV